jgi:hypothetical protein
VLFLGNAVMVAIGSPLYFYIFSFSTAILVLIWYKGVGYKLYIFPIPKNFTMAYITIYFTIILLFL